MSRWMIEKSGSGIEKAGSGIEKAGSGIEKAGSGIEKAGSGIEKAGSGIEKSGSGIRFALTTCFIAAMSLCTTVGANEYKPEGALMVTAFDGKLTVAWAIEGSVFSGVAPIDGSFSRIDLTEVGMVNPDNASLFVAGSGTGREVAGSGTGKEVAGSGTGKEVAGSGTGKEVAGSGTGTEVAGSGTGTEVAGSGTGVEVAGSGTGTDVAGSGTGVEVAGSGTGQDSTILVAGSGTGSEAIAITLPQGTGMHMEISMGCDTATVSVMDSTFNEVVTFENVTVIGATGLCTDVGVDDRISRFEPRMR